MGLSDGVVVLRAWSAGDLDCVRAVQGGTIRHGREWIARQLQRTATGEGISYAIAPAGGGAAVGYVGLLLRPKLETGIIGVHPGDDSGPPPALVFRSQPGNVGIGYWLTEPARGRGLASRAAALLARWALHEGGLTRVEALIEPANLASQRVVERAGFQPEGRLRAYLVIDGQRADALIYSLLAEDLAR